MPGYAKSLDMPSMGMRSHALSARVNPPAPPASPAAAAAEHLSKLPPEHKFAIGGLFAILLGRKSTFWTEAFCRQHLDRVARGMLRLAPEQSEVLTPFLHPEAPTDVRAFTGLLPTDKHDRATLLCPRPRRLLLPTASAPL